MNRIRGILLHMCVVCSLVCMAAKILDWYNPYMDFTGHIWGIQMALYLSALALGIIGTSESLKRSRRPCAYRRMRYNRGRSGAGVLAGRESGDSLPVMGNGRSSWKRER